MYALHPGVIRTELGRNVPLLSIPGVHTFLKAVTWPIVKSTQEGAQTSIYCSVAEELADSSGKYYR